MAFPFSLSNLESSNSRSTAIVRPPPLINNVIRMESEPAFIPNRSKRDCTAFLLVCHSLPEQVANDS
jgi:hypothetical protein